MTGLATWIIGRGGMLGQSLAHALGLDDQFVNHPVDWSANDAPGVVARETERFLEHARDRPWQIIWCAGAGIIGTNPTELAHETAILAAVLETAQAPGTMFLTSSAGGIYGGSRDIPINEGSIARPLSDYGSNKLAQEDLVTAWASRHGGRCVIGRVANLYGPGQRLSKPQGLISQICLATLLRRPVSLYVSLDTLRDYVFVDDCSRMIMNCLDASNNLEPGATKMKILATGGSVSIGALLAQARRVLGRPPAVVMIPSGRTAQQGSALAFKSVVWPSTSAFSLTPLPVGVHRTSEYLRRQLQLGTLA